MPRHKRQNLLGRIAGPRETFVTGIIVILLFLLQQVLFVRIIQVLAFASLAVLAGKRIRWAYFAVMVLSITAFNLFTPIGEVLFSFGPLVVTRGALRQGLLKGFAIPGLVFISLFAVQPTLVLPGRLGGLIARVFYYFERLLEGRKRVTLRGFVGSVDGVLIELSREPADDITGESAVKTGTWGYLLLISILAVNAVPLALAGFGLLT